MPHKTNKPYRPHKVHNSIIASYFFDILGEDVTIKITNDIRKFPKSFEAIEEKTNFAYR